MARPKKPATTPPTQVETLVHPADVARKNIPTAETASLMAAEEAAAPPKLYPRNPDLDPQLVWRGKDAQDSAPLSVPTVPIYIQEKLYPEALIRDLQRVSAQAVAPQADLFGSFDRIKDAEDRLEFYQHAENWSNRMILGDSLLVMNSLAEKEGLRGQVQMIYFDPPYGIRFGSNWQPSTKRRQVEDSDVSREPEQVKAFRDTWRDGVHSYLTYLRDRLFVARELLTETGSIFVQIGDENIHLVRSVLDEVFGATNSVSIIAVQKTGAQPGEMIGNVADFILWYGRDKALALAGKRIRPLYEKMTQGVGAGSGERYDQRDLDGRWYQLTALTSAKPPGYFRFPFEGRCFEPGTRFWTYGRKGMVRLARAGRLRAPGRTVRFKRYLEDFAANQLTNIWNDTAGSGDKIYIVQTSPLVVERCMLMATDPGDLVLDPTCGSGTTAFIAEKWGRRWITTDTSRVALALARSRLMSRPHPAHLLRDSREGAAMEAEITGRLPEEGPFRHDIRHGFVLERLPRLSPGDIANNAELDIIDRKWRARMVAARSAVSIAAGERLMEWQVPRTLPEDASAAMREAHTTFWEVHRRRQAEIDASVARNAEVVFLHDRPYPKKNTVRVTGPFTVESLSPHRVLPADEDDEAVLDALAQDSGAALPSRRPLRSKPDSADDFVTAVLDNLAKAGVQNTKKDERLTFATLRPWPGGKWVAAEGEYEEAGAKRRAAIVIGPEYGTVGADLVREAARECRDWADAMVVCGFAFDPQVGDSTMNLGRLVVLKARMSQELRAAEAYKAGGGNLFVVFGEPDIALDATDAGCVVRLKGVDIFDPTTGEVRASAKVEDDVACWFIDTDYDGDSFFVRHAYFLGGKDPFEKLKTALKAEVDEDAWASLYRTESRPFAKPKSGRIAVKMINHSGDEAMRVFSVA